MPTLEQKLQLMIEDGVNDKPSILFAILRYKRNDYTLEYVEELIKQLCIAYAQEVKTDYIESKDPPHDRD